MLLQLIKQFQFEQWSNTLILNTLKAATENDERAMLLFSHLLSSHSMWLSRVNKSSFTCTLFQVRTLDECELLIHENFIGWQKYLTTVSLIDIEQNIEFLAAWETIPSKRIITIQDAIIHIINHSSYHRGQIVASLKGKVPQLPLSTYIMYASKVIDENG